MLPVEIVACAASRAGAVSPIKIRIPQTTTPNALVILYTRRISPPFPLRFLMLADTLEADGTPFPFESATNHAVWASDILNSFLMPQIALPEILIQRNASHRQSKINIDLSVA